MRSRGESFVVTDGDGTERASTAPEGPAPAKIGVDEG
jgi:hypothetical protein